MKRIEIASVIARDAVLTIFDEPEAGIDIWSFDNLIKMFKDMQKKVQKRAIVIISHQERIMKIADRIILLKNGRLRAWCKPKDHGANWGCKMMDLDKIERDLMREVSGVTGIPEGAYNFRVNGKSIGRQSSEKINIVPKTEKSGIDIYIEDNTKRRNCSYSGDY